MVPIDEVYRRLRDVPEDGQWYLMSVLWQLDPAPPAAKAPAHLQRDVERVVEHIAAHWPQRAEFAGIRTLERLGEVKLDHDETYVLAMISALGDRWDADARPAAIRTDDELRETLLWRAFEIEGGGEISLTNVDKYSHDGAGWADTLRTLAADGTLPRARLLHECLRALGRDFSAYRAGFFSQLYTSLTPAKEELDQPRLIRLLGAPIPATVTFAVRHLTAVDKAGGLDDAAFVDGAGPALTVPAKGTPLAVLTLLTRVRTRNPALTPGVAELYALGLEHQHRDVQHRALTLLRALDARDPVAERLDLLEPTVAREATTWLQATPTPAAASPSPAAASPSPAAASPSPAAASPSPVAANPSPAAASPSPVAASPSPVAASPSPVAASPSPAAASPSPVAASPSPVAAAAAETRTTTTANRARSPEPTVAPLDPVRRTPVTAADPGAAGAIAETEAAVPIAAPGAVPVAAPAAAAPTAAPAATAPIAAPAAAAPTAAPAATAPIAAPAATAPIATPGAIPVAAPGAAVAVAVERSVDERVAALLAGETTPYEIELFLADVAARKVSGDLQGPARKVLRRAENGSLRHQVAALVLGQAPTVRGDLLAERLAEVHAMAAGRAEPRTLLATPTDAAGWIAPEVLVTRLATGPEPLHHDLVAALLRIHPDGRERALRAASDLPGQAGAAVRHALGADGLDVERFLRAPVKPTTAAVWIAAARSRAPLDDDPLLIAAGLDKPGQGPAASIALRVKVQEHQYKEGPHTRTVRWCEQDLGLHRWAADQPTVASSSQPDGGPDWIPWAAQIWPHDAEVFCASALEEMLWAAGTERAYAASATLDALAAHPGRMGPLAAGVLVAGMTTTEIGHRTRAAETFAALVPDRLDPSLVADAMVALAHHGTASRWASTLRSYPASVTVLAGALPRLPRDHPGLHALLTTLHEESVRAGTHPANPGLRAWLEGFSGSTKAARTARALLQEQP
ncbi:DUF6493 family protein [Dactylosporangium sp. CS-033363]|uniref:DUF6493 family protein n=1 Tax=Dactylosporangium sp. CS-033363 TaxID=3239935 RepID=UPI003D8AEEB3